MKSFLGLLAVIFCFQITCRAQNNNSQQNINTIFERMEIQGVDLHHPLLYGYFFADSDKQKLEKLSRKLKKEHYNIIRLEETVSKGFLLQVEKVETHSRTSLHKRNLEFARLAEKFEIQSYDGWEVGHADPSQPLISTEKFKTFLASKTDQELYSIANKLYELEIDGNAIIAFQECIEKGYQLDTCYYKQGICYIGTGKTEIGIEKLKKALEINPSYYKASYNLGAIFYDQGQYSNSVLYYQTCVKLNPDDDRVYYGIGASQYMLSNFSDAKGNCQKALEINPNNTNARLLLNTLSY